MVDWFWNSKFTDLLRQDNPSFWGNWDLSADIKPGAIGILTPGSGAFQHHGDLANAVLGSQVPPLTDWKVSSSNVVQKTAKIDLSGSGETVSAGLEVTWSFGKEESISSTFTISEMQALKDTAKHISDNLTLLKNTAGLYGMLADGEITQGFGVVTSVLNAMCGLNLGSKSSNSSFSIQGSVANVSAMTGGASAGAKGGYTSSSHSGQLDTHLFPSEAGTSPSGLIPIAFTFASFVGGQLLEGWTTNISEISINLDNAHGGTYIVHATATYVIGQKNYSASSKVSGGRSITMAPIPLNATELVITLAFQDSSSAPYRFSWPTPLALFPNGRITIDLYGVWWGATKAIERSTGETGGGQS